MRTAVFKAEALLLLAAVIWGAAFVAQRVAMQHVGPLTFNGVRFALGALTLVPLLVSRRGATVAGTAGARGTYLRVGILTGCVLFIAANLQQMGIVFTTAGKAGFITGLYVVWVPILGVLVGQRTHAMTWLGAILSAIGLYFLSVTGDFQVNRGDALVLACAVVCAVHVLLIGWLSPRVDAFRLAALQFAITAGLSLIAAVAREKITFDGLWAARWAILYGGVCSVGIAYTLQVLGQRTAPPAYAGLLLSLEAVFAALAGWLLLNERMGVRELVGCGLMMTGIVASQLRVGARATEAKVVADRRETEPEGAEAGVGRGGSDCR